MSFSQLLTDKGIGYSLGFKTSHISSIKAGGEAAICVEPKNEAHLIESIKIFKNSNFPYKVIGGCTNTFFDDAGFRGALILTDGLRAIRNLGAGSILVSAGAKLSNIIRMLAKSGISLAEELYGIPGSIGGAVRNNAGAFGRSISDVFEFGNFYLPSENRIVTLSCDDMDFAYRNSVLQHNELILLSAVLKVKIDDCERILDKMYEFLKMRREKQPSNPSLGSFYKRIDGVAPAILIDSLGLKGYSVGGAAVSKKHAGFIVNLGSASAKDILAVAEHVEKVVYNNYGLQLIREAEFIGTEA